MDYKVQILQLDDLSWAVWYKDEQGFVIEKYGFDYFEDVMVFVRDEVLNRAVAV